MGPFQLSEILAVACDAHEMIKGSHGFGFGWSEQFQKGPRTVHEAECRGAEHTVLDGEFMVPSNFFERRRILQVCLERGHVEPDFPSARRDGFDAADILTTEVFGIEHLHHVVVVGIASPAARRPSRLAKDSGLG